MAGRLPYVPFLMAVLLLSGCRYHKGESFTWSATGDTVNYFIAASGSGRHILKKIDRLVRLHEKKEDECRVVYISDSSDISATGSVLLFNSVLPDLKDDMLSKGFMGTFGTREVITYLVVTKNDFERYLTPVKIKTP